MNITQLNKESTIAMMVLVTTLCAPLVRAVEFQKELETLNSKYVERLSDIEKRALEAGDRGGVQSIRDILGKLEEKPRRVEDNATATLVKIGSKWVGTLDGKNNHSKVKQAATGTITASNKDGFQIKVSLGEDIEWQYDCKKVGTSFTIEAANLLRAPKGFPGVIGLARIRTSKVVLIEKPSKNTLEISLTRLDNNFEVDAKFQLEQQ